MDKCVLHERDIDLDFAVILIGKVNFILNLRNDLICNLWQLNVPKWRYYNLIRKLKLYWYQESKLILDKQQRIWDFTTPLFLKSLSQ